MINAGVIGCGGIARFHLDGYQKLSKDVKLLCVADANEELAKKTAAQYECEYVTDYHELLDNKEIDCVSICLPNFLHYQASMESLDAGKHTLCEKPMTTTVEDALRLVEKVKQADAIYQVGYMKRYNSAFILVKELLKKIGRLETAHFRAFHPCSAETLEKMAANPDPGWKHTASQTGGGMFVHGGSHSLDLLRWYCGDPTAVCAVVKNIERLDIDYQASCFFEMDNGMGVFFETYWHPLTKVGVWEDGWDEKIELNGTKGRIEVFADIFNCDRIPLVKLYLEEDKQVQKFTPPGDNQFHHQIKKFAENIKSGSKPQPDVVDGYRVQEITDAVYLAGKEHKRVEIKFTA